MTRRTLNETIDVLEIGTRTIRALKAFDVVTVADAMKLSDAKFLTLGGVGRKSLRELREAIEAFRSSNKGDGMTDHFYTHALLRDQLDASHILNELHKASDFLMLAARTLDRVARRSTELSGALEAVPHLDQLELIAAALTKIASEAEQ